METREIVLLIATLACVSCHRSDKEDRAEAKHDESSWSMGLPETRGDVPEIRLSLSSRGVTMRQSYSINGQGWRETLAEAKSMNPKPIIIVNIENNINDEIKSKSLNEIASIYNCVNYKCFYILK
jgi:hypothetical protein